MPPKGPAHKFIAVDLFVMLAAVALAVVSWLGFPPNPPNVVLYKHTLLVIVLIRLFLHYTYGLYDFRANNNAVDVLYNTFCAVSLGSVIELCVLQFAYIYYANGLDERSLAVGQSPVQLSRIVVVLTWVYSLIGFSTWRLLYLRRRRRWAYDLTTVLIVGAGEFGETVRQEIEQYSRMGHRVVGFIDDEIDETQVTSSGQILGKLEDIRQIVQEHKVDEIIVTSNRASRGELLAILSQCEQTR
ncbi:MAG TPA: hypothetical protein PKH07_16535, partial [bacterium]|nr:hypothetical protein [bacterium]